MKIDERKKLFRYLLRSIFFDDCPEIGDDHVIDFYNYLLDSLEVKAEIEVENDSDDYFLTEMTSMIMSSFPEMDSVSLLNIVKNNDNFKNFVMENTGLPMEFIDLSAEHLISDFQEIKYGYQFTRKTE